MNSKEKEFIKSLISLMIPLSLQGLLQNVATTVDSLMLGVISKSAMSAAAIAVVFLNFHVMFLIAIGTTLSAMMAREYSNGNNTIIKKINTISMATGFIITIIFFVVCKFFPSNIMSFYTDEIEIIEKGAKYLRIISFAYLFKTASFIRERYLWVFGQEKKVTICSVICNILNIILNAVLIYGIGVIPSFEIEGAAYATLVAAILEFILIYFVLRVSSIANSNEVANKSIYKEFYKRFGFFSLQLFSYMLGINFLTSAYGHLNANLVAVFAVISTVGGWLSASRDGLQDSSIILMGKYMTKSSREETIKMSRFCEKIGAFAGIFFVLIFLVLTIIFASKYVDHNNVTITLFIIIIIISSINLYVGILTTMIQGATLIPGGDIVVNLFIDLGFSLFYAAPLLIFGYVVSYHYLILYIILLKSDEIVKYPLIRYRSRKNKWLNKYN